MTSIWTERASAFIDGELSEHEVHQLIRDMEQDPERLRVLQRYQLMGEVIRGDVRSWHGSAQSSVSVQASALRRFTGRFFAQGAVAASVMLAVVGVYSLSVGSPAGIGQPEAVASAAPRLMTPEAQAPVASVAGFTGAVEPQVMVPQYLRKPVEKQTADPMIER
jgi:negative regulator of sigma E activity